VHRDLPLPPRLMSTETKNADFAYFLSLVIVAAVAAFPVFAF
jgi:hypothetical protein